MQDDDFCDTKLSLGIGSGVSVPESDHKHSKRVQYLNLSSSVDQAQAKASCENVGEIPKKI